MKKVSVIMSVFSETKNQLSRAIDSILDQSFHDFEFIIILDNPENEELKSVIQNYQKQDSRIVFIENEKNIKLWASLNKWIQKANWKYIARMDADDACNTERLQKQYDYLESNSSVDLLFTWWTQINQKDNIELRIPKSKDFENIKKTFFYKSPLLHASLMCKTEILKKHRYPEIDRPEDFSLFLDLIYYDYSFDIIEENLYTYFLETDDKSRKYEKIKIFSENYLGILSKNIRKFYHNIYFWWMYFLVIIQWILSRNKFIFWLFFEWLQNLYKKIFL